MNSTLRTVSFLIILLALPLVYGCSSDAPAADTPATAPPATKVSISLATTTSIQDILTLPGNTAPDADVTISSERSGVVEWIGFEEGDTVSANQILAKVDLKALGAELARAKANYGLANKKAGRRSELVSDNMVSREEYDNAKTSSDVAGFTLQEAQINFDQGNIRTPIAGVVNKRYLEPGEYVDKGNPMFDIVNVSTLRIHVDVPEIDVRWIKPGTEVDILVDAFPERHWKGTVSFVSFKADPFTKTFQVRILVDNKDLAIRPGMLARVSILKRTLTDVITVPLFAILSKGGERLVYVEENGLARARTVTIGLISEDQAQILSGINAGDHVIVAGQANVDDGSKVEVQ